MIQTYKDLSIYQRSYKAAVDMYQVVKVFPRDELILRHRRNMTGNMMK